MVNRTADLIAACGLKLQQPVSYEETNFGQARIPGA